MVWIMQKFISQKQNNDIKETKVKEYLNGYLLELQRHFDISDKKMRIILLRVYKDLSPLNFIKNWFSVVKSEYKKKFKELKWK